MLGAGAGPDPGHAHRAVTLFLPDRHDRGGAGVRGALPDTAPRGCRATSRPGTWSTTRRGAGWRRASSKPLRTGQGRMEAAMSDVILVVLERPEAAARLL